MHLNIRTSVGYIRSKSLSLRCNFSYTTLQSGTSSAVYTWGYFYQFLLISREMDYSKAESIF
ncbi:hypothetical protein T07_14078 [Trichinella nelsoni]|uniref:Uncharacterized protein n=1 Tax=Trichinella nelsoni TaxID=6336 RepID=A0A0V0RK44_9BILA|nr:hypothetical protein T07_14078 [Trichinella nelsoni]